MAVTAVLAGLIQFMRDPEGPECKAPGRLNCVGERVARIPEQPHVEEEPPSYEASEETVVVSLSPYVAFRRISKQRV
jgi:hypothetical protein